jgi:hypothetical protein
MNKEFDFIPGPRGINEDVVDKLDLEGSIAKLMRLMINNPNPDSYKKNEIDRLTLLVGEETANEIEDIVDWGSGPFKSGIDSQDLQSYKERLQYAQELDHGYLEFNENGNLELQLPSS